MNVGYFDGERFQGQKQEQTNTIAPLEVLGLLGPGYPVNRYYDDGPEDYDDYGLSSD